MLTLAEKVKINANYTTIYTQIVDGISETCNTSSINFADNFHDCQMSASAVKTIKKAVNVILYLSRQAHYQAARKKRFSACTTKRNAELQREAAHEVNDKHLCTFLTLTLPAKQTHTDVELTKYCINPFLSYARKYFGVKHYIWKKELQKNGNLHYHLVTDRYIDAFSLRRAWNRLLNRGRVDGVKNPFDYVDRYKKHMQNLFASGFVDSDVLISLDKSAKVLERVADEIKQQENNNITLSDVQKEQIKIRVKTQELENMRRVYNAEMQKDASQRWTNPNSTDISAIKTPKAVSSYVAKYIAKDIDDDDELNEYLQEVKHYKDMIFFCLNDIKKKRENGETVTDLDLDSVEYWKETLKEIREKYCPIKGKLWFKSASLTPFLAGASDFINYQIGSELDSLISYLKQKENENQGKKYVVYSYELNDDGTTNFEKCNCITLLINIFQLQMLKDKGKLKFPTLVRMWQHFIYDCKTYNRKRGLYSKDSEKSINI